MKSDEALRLLDESLSRPSSTPTLGGEDRDQYLYRQREALRSCVIEPVLIKATASTWAKEQCGLPDVEFEMLALVHQERNWLLLNPDTKEFFLAYGNHPDNDRIELLGFSSDDALAEWLG